MPDRSASSPFRAALTTSALVAAIVVPGTVAPGVAEASSLDAAERAAAARSAAATPWDAPRRAGADHALGVQTLLVALDERKADATDPGRPARRAHVYQYDHRDARARRLLIDVAAGGAPDVLGQRTLDGTHWPLNAAERDWVRTRLAATPWLVDALAAERAARGLPPAGPSGPLAALDAKASVHEPVDPGDPCAVGRCALVSLFDADGRVSWVEPVVRFADGAVRRLGRTPP